MSGIIEGIFTDEGKVQIRNSIAGSLIGAPHTRIVKFKIGEGGFVTTAGGRLPNDPLSREGENDIEANITNGLYFFEKAFTPTDISINPDGSIRFDVVVEYAEANDNGTGDDPTFFEIGLFDQDDNMIVYATFPEETKNLSKRLIHHTDLYFEALALTNP